VLEQNAQPVMLVSIPIAMELVLPVVPLLLMSTVRLVPQLERHVPLAILDTLFLVELVLLAILEVLHVLLPEKIPLVLLIIT